MADRAQLFTPPKNGGTITISDGKLTGDTMAGLVVALASLSALSASSWC